MRRPGKSGVGIGGDSKAERDNEVDNEVDEEVEDEVDNEIGKKSQNLSKSKKIELGFLTSGARMAFTKLKQVFIKAPILHYFDLEHYIWVEIDASGYAIGGILSKLTLDNLGL